MYIQLADLIQNQVEKGELLPGTKIDSVNQLVEKYDVSRVTVISALDELLKRGLIISKQGKGTYIKNAEHIEELTSLKSFEEIISINLHESEKKILSFKEVKNPFIDKRIYPESKKLLKIVRMHYERDIPILKIDIFLDLKISNLISLEEVKKYSILELLNSKNINITSASQIIRSISANESLSKLMLVDINSALLKVERQSFDSNNSLKIYSEFYYRQDAYAFKIDLKR